MKPLDRLLLASGLLIPLWLLAGVWLTAQAYPGYDHLQQASQQLHNLSGLLMFLSLTLASALWAWLGNRIAGSRAFALFSLACVVLAIITVALMGQAAQNGQLFGLYQRLNYGVSVIWVASLAWASLRTPADSPLRMAVI